MPNATITIPIKGTELYTVLEAQRAIDKIFASEYTHTGSLLHGDENILETINHINLDDASALSLVESLEVHGARIYPGKTSAEVQRKIVIDSILETQFIQEGKDFYKLSLGISKKVSILLLQLLVRFDRLCERALFAFEKKHEVEKNVVVGPVQAFGPVPQKPHNPYFSKQKEITHIPVVCITTQSELPKYIFNITRTYIGVEDNVSKKTLKNKSIFIDVLKILYTELRYGRRQ